MQSEFSLDPRLARDSHWISDLPLCQLRLMQDTRFFWLLLVPRRASCSEWFDLPQDEQVMLHEETMRLAKLLKQLTQADKINIGALGNLVSQLHVHVIARHIGDACWPGAVWGSAVETMPQYMLDDRVSQLHNAVLKAGITGVN